MGTNIAGVNAGCNAVHPSAVQWAALAATLALPRSIRFFRYTSENHQRMLGRPTDKSL